MRPSGGTVAGRVVVFIFGIIQAFILLRIVLLLMDAREGNDLVSFILNTSQIFVAPFEGILRTEALTSGRLGVRPRGSPRPRRLDDPRGDHPRGCRRLPARAGLTPPSLLEAAAPTRGRRLTLSATCGSVIGCSAMTPGPH